MKIRKIWLLVLVFSLFIFSGCRAKEDKVKERVITDMLGREVEVGKEIEDIIAVGPGALRLVTHLEAGDKVVGVEEGEYEEETARAYNLAKPSYRELPIIGPDHGGDAELMAAKEPDLIVFSGDRQRADNLSTQLGVPVLGIDYVDLGPERNKLYQAWELLGEILAKENRAEKLIVRTEKIIADLKAYGQRTTDLEKRVYVGGISYRGGQSLEGTKIPFPPLEFLDYKGTILEPEDRSRVKSLTLNREEIVNWDPEIIFIDQANLDLVKEDINRRREYRLLSAIEEGEVYGLLPYASYHRNIAVILANSYYLGQVLYPSQFADLEVKDKAGEIFDFYLGKDVYPKLAKNYYGFCSIDI